MKICVCLISIVTIFKHGNSLFWDVFGGSGGITYQLYTRQNPVNGQPLIYWNSNSIANSNFNNARPTRIIIHGFGQSGRSTINRDLKNSYLVRNDFNVIIVDWSLISSPFYQFARYKVDTTGVALARFVDWMNVNFGTLHLVGYDLGAHIAGIAGKNTARGKIARIIGLDPSLPLFNTNAASRRLSVGDAQLVEVFHSNGGQLGIFQAIGNVDFYINNGRNQPECASNRSCSHYRAVFTFSRLLNRQNNYVVIPCENVGQVEAGCSLDPIEIFLEELNPSGIYQILTVNAEAINKEVEFIMSTDTTLNATEAEV